MKTGRFLPSVHHRRTGKRLNPDKQRLVIPPAPQDSSEGVSPSTMPPWSGSQAQTARAAICYRQAMQVSTHLPIVGKPPKPIDRLRHAPPAQLPDGYLADKTDNKTNNNPLSVLLSARMSGLMARKRGRQ